jgi:hypothetical protein
MLRVLTAVTLAFTLATIATSDASAKPKKGHDGQCHCMCDAPSGNFAGNYYNPGSLSCNAFIGATCNIENPDTGLIETGKLSSCSTVFTWDRTNALQGQGTLGTLTVDPGPAPQPPLLRFTPGIMLKPQ